MRLKYLAAILFLLLFGTSFPIAYNAYFASQLSQFDIFQGVATFMFWFSIVGLAFLFPLRSAAVLFGKYLRTLRGALIFFSYISVHLVLYGLLLEGILAYSFNVPRLVSQPSINLVLTPLYPASLTSILFGFGFNPSVDIFIPPVYALALSLYTMSVSIIIAVLVVTNVMKVVEIGKLCGTALRSRTLVVLPALGVIGGAACCLSLPVLISLAAPTAAVVSNSAIVYYSAYFLFPAATAIGLKYNMDSTNRIASKLSKIAAPKRMFMDSPN